MLVVSDTSPISNLLQVGQLELLWLVFGYIVIPEAVYRELSEIPSQKETIDNLTWIQIESPNNQLLISQLEETLDLGESQSIVLALELNADFLIIDEMKGRQIAEDMGVRIVGLLGTLLKAKEKGHIPSVSMILQQLLEEAGFYISASLKNHIINLAQE